MIIHHSGCGACNMNADHFLHLMRERGITERLSLTEKGAESRIKLFLTGRGITLITPLPMGEGMEEGPVVLGCSAMFILHITKLK